MKGSKWSGHGIGGTNRVLPNRLIFPANPGGGRSPSHDHDGLEARLGNDHATSRPSLLPTKQPRIRGFTRLWAVWYLEGSLEGSFPYPTDRLRLFFEVLLFYPTFHSLRISSTIAFVDAFACSNCARWGRGEVRRKADESNSLSSSPRKITIEDEDKS